MKAVLCAALFCLGAGVVHANDTEVARTWEAAQVWLPGTVNATSIEALDEGETPRAVVLYAHGCDGLSRITTVTARFLADAGHLVVAPDSFARQDKPVSCNAAQQRGGLHRGVLRWRQQEMQYALAQLREKDELRDVPIVLMGHSEGGITVATMAAPDAAMRVIEGWTCHAGWPEYRGLNAPKGQPALALVGEEDPWFRLPVLSGDCGAFMEGETQVSRVYSEPDHLGDKHWLSADKEVQDLILDFIDVHLPAGDAHGE
ncbi:dienelactone hydrolase family protein [Roseovarius nanhaiticus]|uniref:dienelactone hydrolase family protein n=1 Tax=Roseovarius nanhaiticus TaxID=573024 RepID=UPI002493B90B|nr:dienelactone hydrolase family protein [Roseovarius nanhaiticus]